MRDADGESTKPHRNGGNRNELISWGLSVRTSTTTEKNDG